jgi:beta-phosphoglucomutase-like phosphatase (HAD superfamily)
MSIPLPTDTTVTPDTAQALLFDCDGTLVDSVAAWEQAWTRALGAHGVAITPAWYRARAGLSPRDLIRAAETDHRVPMDVDSVVTRGIDLYVESAGAVRPIQRVLDIARAHHGRVPLAVVSGGPRVGVEAALEAVGVRGLFDHVVAIDDVAAGKPAPDLYLRALQAVSKPAAVCLAYEDTDEGLRAAAAAGIPAVDVRSENRPPRVLERPR